MEALPMDILWHMTAYSGERRFHALIMATQEDYFMAVLEEAEFQGSV
jgi:hypothetical protein